MFKIDKSSVEYLDANRSFIVVNPSDQKRAGANASSAASSKSYTLANSQMNGMEEHYSTGDVHSEPERVLYQAHMQAERIVSEASTRAERIKSEAYQHAYREGFALGREEGGQKAIELEREYAQAFKNIVTQVKAHLNEIDAELEENVLRLSFSIAKKIINIQMEKNDIVFEQLLRRTIQLNQSDERFAIRLNPRQYERFFTNGTEELRAELKSAPFVVIPDPSLSEDGIVLESPDGIFRNGIDTQLNKLKAALGVKGSGDE